MGKLKNISGKPKPVSADGYGDRIKRAISLREHRTGERPTLAEIGAQIAKMIGRKEGPFSAGTVSGWQEERSEPTLVVFLALGQWTGAGACSIAFGSAGRLSADNLRGADETPPGYYKKFGDDEEERGSA